MPKINLLPTSVSELIAAGEVVERPASAVKETVENAIDAGSHRITVEIKNGGITFIRIADDGCGIEADDVPRAFLRHATSKIRAAADLDGIVTLGFRGEALAAIAGVSRCEMFTKPAGAAAGTHYVIEGGKEKICEEAGCPDGTTLIIRDIFFNTPARMKFLKKDSTEGAAVGAVVERMALSHPEIAFKFIKDGKQVFQTAGDGRLENAVYSVLGREIHSTLIPVSGSTDGVSVTGFTCKPVFCRASRAFQFIFLNGRLVLSKTVTAAAEQAYKDSNMVGRFPVFILFLSVLPQTVDVNVHPAKTEVRFSDERRIFSAVYYAVKSAVTALDTRPEITIKKPNDTFYRMTADKYRQTAAQLESKPEPAIEPAPAPEKSTAVNSVLREDNIPFFMRPDVKAFEQKSAPQTATQKTDIDIAADDISDPTVRPGQKPVTPAEEQEQEPEKEIRLIGEAFSVYIIVECGGEIYLVDKHAAHERILYNGFKKNNKISSQQLLVPVNVTLTAAEHAAAVENADLLLKAGFEVDDFGGTAVMVRAIPAMLDKKDVAECVAEAVSTLAAGGGVNTKDLDDIYHTVACKAAIKAGYYTTDSEKLSLAKKVLFDDEVRYCPHGRPVAYAIKKSQLDKYFGRIQ